MNSDSIMYTADRPEGVFSSGSGAWLEDREGKRYLDFVQGWAVNCLGHSPPSLRDALTQQAGLLWNASPAFYNQPQLRLARSLTAASGLGKAFL